MAESASKVIDVSFSPGALTFDQLDAVLRRIDPLRVDADGFRFHLAQVTFIPLDVITVSLCLFNQLAQSKKRVVLVWEADTASFGFCERIGYFERLHPDVKVEPHRPSGEDTSYGLYRDSNPDILEITEIPLDRSTADDALRMLGERLGSNLQGDFDTKEVAERIWTVASELVSNIHEHSETPIAGFMAVQPYPARKKVALCIADSGLGIIETIRDSDRAKYGHERDEALLLRAFREGLSRQSSTKGRGCGLTTCARIAQHYEGNLTVRTMSTWARLVTRSMRTGMTVALLDDNRALIKGTQISLEFYLDRIPGRG